MDTRSLRMNVESSHRSGQAALIASVVLNLLLVGFLAVVPGRTALPGGVPSFNAAASSTPAATNPPVPVSEPPTVYATNRFHWRAMECEDFERFVTNLRSVGCPEKTLGDIVRADVQKLYELKTAAVSPSGGFWTSGVERERAEQAAAQEVRRLEVEQAELLAKLLGPANAFRSWDFEDSTELAVMLFLLGPVPEPLPERVLGELAQGEDRVQQAGEEYRHLPVAAEERRVEQLRQECLANVRRLLTDSQYREFMHRLAALAMIDNYLNDFRPTSAELRGLAAIYFDAFGVGDMVPVKLFNSGKRDNAQDRLFRDRARVFLGEARYAQLKEDGKRFDE